MSELIMNENAVSTSTPSSGERSLYPKNDGWYEKNDSNVEKKIGGADNLVNLSDVGISNPVKGDLLVYDLNDDGKWSNGKLNGFVFGCSATEASKSDFQSTSSTSYVNYFTHTSIPCEAGKRYRIGVFALVNGSSSSNDTYVEVTIQQGTANPIQAGEMRVEPKEAGTDNQVPASGFFYYTAATDDPVVIRMNFKSEHSSYSAYMFYGAIEWWRTEL